MVASADGVRVEQPTGSNRSPLSGQQSATVATDRRTMTVQSERRRSSPGMSRRRGELSADTELRQLAAGWRVSDHKHADELERSQGSEVKRAELSHDRVSPQALEEAAANAAEEEQRRLQTQTELQDRYRTNLEKEILVRVCARVRAWQDVSTSCLWRHPRAAFLFSRAASSVTVTTGDAVT